MQRLLLALGGALVFMAWSGPTTGLATPVCAGPEHLAPPPCPRVFQEPILSTDWVQFGPDAVGRSEFVDGTEKLQSMYPQYIKLKRISDIIHDPFAVSVGIDGLPPWKPNDAKDGLPLYVVEVTDFSVPDKDKAYAVITAVHSAEPCGREAMVRTPEDLALMAASNASLDNATIPGKPTTTIPVRELLRREKLIFLYNSPDGWRSGDTDPPNMLAEQQSNSRPPAQSQYGGVRFTYSEENGRGLNTNRMAPAIGWNFRQPPPYPEPGQNPVMTEPEGIATWNYWNYLTREHGRVPDSYLDIHGTFPGAQVFSADSVANPRQNDLALELVLRISAAMDKQLDDKAGGVDVAGVLNQNAPNSLLQWTSTGTSFDTINYTTSGDQMTWISQLGSVSALIENNCIPGANGVWSPATQYVFVDSARAGIRTLAVQTLAQQSEHPRLDTKGNVGFVFNPDVLTDATNHSLPPKDFPNNPYFPHGFTQTPYSVTSMHMFEDYSTYALKPFQPVNPSEVAAGTKLDGLDTLVIAEHALPADATGSDVDSRAYYDGLKRFVSSGGNLVVTDHAVEALAQMGLISHDAIKTGYGYVGYIDIQDRNSDFTKGRSNLERQTYDPIGLGYEIRIERDGHWRGQPESGSHNMAPIVTVDRTAWEGAKGVTIATSDPLSDGNTTADEGTATNKVALGTMPLGKGRIVFIGPLLPDPTDRYPHWFGLESYGPTALGHHIFQTAVTYSRGAVGGASTLAGQAPGASLPSTSGRANPWWIALVALVLAALSGATLRRAIRLS